MFHEFSYDVFYFCRTLLTELDAAKCRNVFFLSREGQFLKIVFDLIARSENVKISSHYKCVSRASTFLPSLEVLEKEKFDTLFRQYRNISVFEFIKSLGLGHIQESIRVELDCSNSDLERRIIDLPNSLILSDVFATKCFVSAYQTARVTQKKLISEYFLSDLKDDEDICLVDVGWKGTIQDHLFKILDIAESSRILKGYYMGLLYPTKLAENNKKRGIIFHRDKFTRSKKFWLFNENRALFELLLGANHGSALAYKKEDSNVVEVDFQPFIELDQYENIIAPIQNIFLMEVKRIMNSNFANELDIRRLAIHHSRMVFSPTSEELKLFHSMFQYENFGVFENTTFKPDADIKMSAWAVMKAILRHDESKLGFWPFIYLKLKYGVISALIYRMRIRFLP